MNDIITLINNNSWDKVYELIKRNKINLQDKLHNNNNILHLACINNKKKIIKLLINKDPNLLYTSNNDGNTCAHLLASYGYGELLQSILQFNPALIDLQNDKGETILNLMKDDEKFTRWFIKNNKKIDKNEKSINVNILLLHSILKSDNKDKYTKIKEIN